MNSKINDFSKIPVIVFFAPTASGKTALMHELFSCKKKGSHFILNAEVVSADSMQVYKGMNVATAKPDKKFCSEIPHHLIDIVEPDVQFSAADFVFEADKACSDIYSRGKIPVVCGGTGFYIRNFLYGLPPTPESDFLLREKLNQRIKNEGNASLYSELQKVDKESAAKINVNDSYRIVRALEIFYSSGKKRSEFTKKQELRKKYDFLFIVLEPQKNLLYEKINSRVDEMFNEGLKDEVKNLMKKGYDSKTPGMKAIGYSEWFNNFDEDKIREEIKLHSRKYAKKQYTYVREIQNAIKIPYEGSDSDIEKIRKIIKDFINDFESKKIKNASN